MEGCADKIAGARMHQRVSPTLLRSDSEIKRDVEDELRWDPEIIDPADIAVSMHDGVVTLAGFVSSYKDKYEAEWAAKRVAGVVGVANDIEVRLPDSDQRPDPEIARDAVQAIRLQLPEVWENIKVGRQRGLGDARGHCRVAIPARGCRARRATDQGREGYYQPGSTCAEGGSFRGQTQNRGGIETAGRAGGRPHCRRGQGR
jgi:hypothetical protein